MKNIIRFKILNPEGSITIDGYNPIFGEMAFSDAIETFLPYTKLFKQIVIKNFTKLSADLITRLTNQYLHGAEILFDTPKRGFMGCYKASKSRPFYTYQWTPLDLTAPIPKSLAQFTFEYNGVKTTYLNAIKSLKSTKYLPNEIWNALDIYSRQQIDKCREYNKGNYAFAEEWYKQLMKDCLNHKIKMVSPNEKTYFEAIAEIDFEKSIPVLPDGQRPLNDKELRFLYQYAPAYGVDIPKFEWRINTRKTAHGYTEEPEQVLSGLTQSDFDRMIFNPKSENALPKFARRNLAVKSYENDKMLRDAYFNLIWIMKHLKDDGLMPDWHRCPHCHKLYREIDGCECGACQPIEFIQADNLFYGNASTYEDIDALSEVYSDILEEYQEQS